MVLPRETRSKKMTGKEALFIVAVSTFSLGLQALGMAIAWGWF